VALPRGRPRAVLPAAAFPTGIATASRGSGEVDDMPSGALGRENACRLPLLLLPISLANALAPLSPSLLFIPPWRFLFVFRRVRATVAPSLARREERFGAANDEHRRSALNGDASGFMRGRRTEH